MMHKIPRLIGFLLLGLSACGFHSVYGTHDDSTSDVAEQLQQVAIDSIPDRQGQILRNALIDRMWGKGRPAQPKYTLTVNLKITQSDIGQLSNAVSTLSELDTTADYVLTDLKGHRLFHSTAHSQSNFSRLSDEYATLVAHDSAVERTAREIGEQIVNRLNVYFSAPDPTLKTPVKP